MRTLVMVTALVAALASPAAARDGIVLESYAGKRPDDAAKQLEPLLVELGQRGFDAGDAVGRLYEGKVSRPLQNNLPADFAKQLEAGKQLYISGNFAGAVDKIAPLIDTAHDNSAAFAKNQPLRQHMLDGLIVLALAQDRNGDPKAARATFGELIRSFPGTKVPVGTWGQAAGKLFADVERELQQTTQGRLFVRAPGDGEIYVNERFEQTGSVVKNLVPGEYRIFVRNSTKQSRTYRVMVSPVGDTRVTIDLDLDDAVNSSGWVGLAYATSGDRERFEAKHAATVAQAIDEKAVVVVGIDRERGVIFGALVALSGKDERRASIPLTSGAPSKVQLARFLAGEPASADLQVLVGAGAPSTSSSGGGSYVAAQQSDTGGSRRWGGWPIVTGGLALASVGVGAYLLKVDGSCPDGGSSCQDVRATAAGGYATLGAAGVLVGVTVYLIVTRPKDPPTRSAYLVPTGDGGAVAGMWLRF